MTPFVRGFSIAAVLFGAFALFSMWFIHRPVEIVATCRPQVELFSVTP